MEVVPFEEEEEPPFAGNPRVAVDRSLSDPRGVLGQASAASPRMCRRFLALLAHDGHGFAENGALRRCQPDWRPVDGLESPCVHHQRGRRDSAELFREFPQHLVDAPKIAVGDSQSLPIVQCEADRPPDHHRSITNRYLNRSSNWPAWPTTARYGSPSDVSLNGWGTSSPEAAQPRGGNWPFVVETATTLAAQRACHLLPTRRQQGRTPMRLGRRSSRTHTRRKTRICGLGPWRQAGGRPYAGSGRSMPLPVRGPASLAPEITPLQASVKGRGEMAPPPSRRCRPLGGRSADRLAQVR